MDSAKRADSTNHNFLAFVVFSSISAVPEAGNPANPKGLWKWLPQTTLQKRQFLGFCGVPLSASKGVGFGRYFVLGGEYKKV